MFGLNNGLLQKKKKRLTVIKSPRYTGGDLMFLYAAAAGSAADTCSRDNFWTTFWISFIFGTIVGPDL